MSCATDIRTGRPRNLQDPGPVFSQDTDEPDCKFCESKNRCARQGRLFFVGEKYSPCRLYVDYRKKLEEEHKRAERLKEFKKITIPTVRPEGAAADCIYCKLLDRPHNFRNGPFQGEEKTCSNYAEVKARPEGEAEHCIFCLMNFYCERGRVRKGTTCERYREYKGE
jgi:hypothetical protein